MAEIGIVRAGGQYETAVSELCSVGEPHRALRRVDCADLAQNDVDVCEPSQNATNGARNVGRRQCGGRDLIKERHEQMVVLTVDDRDLGLRATQLPGTGKAAEPCPDD